MAVYVDNMRRRETVGTVRGRWSHLIADTEDELHAFARVLGLQRRWYQSPTDHKGRPYPPNSYAANTWHYDVVDTKRMEAIALGAIPVDFLDLPDLIEHRMATGKCRDNT